MGSDGEMASESGNQRGIGHSRAGGDKQCVGAVTVEVVL
jgi:hypothetical protein